MWLVCMYVCILVFHPLELTDGNFNCYHMKRGLAILCEFTILTL